MSTIDRLTEIKNGIITFPPQIRYLVLTDSDSPYLNNTDILNECIDRFWDRVVANFFLEKPTSTIEWMETFPSEQIFNTMIYHLTKAGWIESVVEMNYAYVKIRKEKILSWINEEQLNNAIFRNKFVHYKLNYESNNISDLVKVNGKLTKTGLVRLGFMRCSNLPFYYDLDKLAQYRTEIAQDIEKGLGITKKEISYQEICDCLVDYNSCAKEKMSLNRNYSDSRGRAIFQCTRKILNPISHKPARALLETPYSIPLDSEGENALNLFVAELLGQKFKTIAEKAEFGRESLETAYLPEGLELEERIWLERIYEAYPNRSKEWNIPIEVD